MNKDRTEKEVSGPWTMESYGMRLDFLRLHPSGPAGVSPGTILASRWFGKPPTLELPACSNTIKQTYATLVSARLSSLVELIPLGHPDWL